jgi:hypothetical protein
MQNEAKVSLPAPKRIPWNKGKLTGAKPPLRQKHVWAIRTKLQIDQKRRDLAMFNVAIDSKLRGCDFVALKGHRSKRLFRRSGDCSPERDRATRQVRIDGANAPSPGLLYPRGRQDAWPIPIHIVTQPREMHDHETVCPAIV